MSEHFIGKIIKYDPLLKEGIITYKKRFRQVSVKFIQISFKASSVLNHYRGINVGSTVFFSIGQPNGSNEAINIKIKGIKRKAGRPLKQVDYISQNWEELQEILEDTFQPDKVKHLTEEANSSDKDLIYRKLFPYEVPSLGLAIIDNKIRLVNLTKDGSFNYQDQSQKHHNILYPSFLKEAAMEIAIEEFEDLVNSISASENDFQNFFKRNPQFILDENYKKAHPHVILEQNDDRKLIPDFVLEPVKQNSFCDLLELKLPSSKIFVMKENRERYSSAIFEASAQLRTYSKYFDDRHNREKFEHIYPYLKIYKPKLYIVIGRKSDENSAIKRDIENEFPHLVINNYDDLLERMVWRKKKLEEINKLFR